MPPWAWALIGVAAGALLIGGVWFAYEAGRSAGSAPTGASTEATVTEVAEVLTETVEPPEAPPTSGAGVGTSVGTQPGTDPGSSKVPATPAPSTPATTGSGAGAIKLGSALTLQHGNLILPGPKTWKTVYMTSGGGGSWSGPLFPLAKGQVRMKLKVIGGNGTFLWLGLGHVVPSPGIYWMWGNDHATNQEFTTAPVAIEAGQYRIETLGTPKWEISLQQ